MLSARTGIARSTITDAERGQRATSVPILVELLDVMGYELIVVRKAKNGKQTQKRRIAEATVSKTL